MLNNSGIKLYYHQTKLCKYHLNLNILLLLVKKSCKIKYCLVKSVYKENQFRDLILTYTHS